MRADNPSEGKTREDPTPRAMGGQRLRSPVCGSRMIRALLIASLTFLSLGAYYQVAEEGALERSTGETQTEMLRIARSSALFGINRMKQSLLENWIDQRTAGGYGGGRYRAVAVLKRNRGTVRAVGIAARDGGEEARYSVRVDVFRRTRSLVDASSGYIVLVRVPGGDYTDSEPFSFMDFSQYGD